LNYDFIKLSRKILDWEWYQDVNTSRVFIHMLIKANWKDGEYKGYIIPRGSFVSSFRKLEGETGLTVKEVRTAISHLKETGEIALEVTKHFTIFSIKNYEFYQKNEKEENKKEDTEKGTQNGTKKGTPKLKKTIENRRISEEFFISNGTQDGTQNGNDRRILKKYIYLSDRAREEESLKLFEEFWKVYPKQVSRMLAEQAYAELLLTTQGLGEEQVVAAAKNYAEACKILKTREKYIKMPHNWLKESTWIDYLPENYKKPQEVFKQAKGDSAYKNRFNNFEDRKYSMDDMERQLLGIKDNNE